MGGLIQEEDRRTRVTMPWIGDLPLIGNLLSSFKTERVTTEVILTITPRIIQSTPPSANNQAFWSGTEFTYATSPLFSNSAKKASPYGDSDPGLRSVPSLNGVGKKSQEGAPAGGTLADLGTPGPLLAVQPEETAVQAALGLVDFSVWQSFRRMKLSAPERLRIRLDVLMAAIASASRLARRGK